MKKSLFLATLGGLGAISLSSCQGPGSFPQNPQLNARFAAFEAGFATSTHEIDPQLGEALAPNEAAATQEIEKHILNTLKKNHVEPPMRRDVHAKHHGCVKAQFQALPQNLPPQLRVGVFAQPRVYPAWVRFSNGNSDARQADSKGDIRGMAVKLMGVPGKKLLPAQQDAQTQDFVMMNNQEFFIENLKDYVAFSEAVSHGGLGLAGFAITHPSVAYRLYKIFSKKTVNPLETEFFSATAYKLGPAAIKFRVQPCQAGQSQMPDNPSPDFLREAMSRTLKQQSGCFDFQVQVQSNPQQMPVENATVAWPEAASPYLSVARLTIPVQDFESPAQMDFCENLSFTPWHALSEHRPLGVTNRVRKSVYELISEYRHTFNKVPRQEPEGFVPF